MTTPRSPAREMACRLLDRETAGATEVARLEPAMQRAWARVEETLRRSVGEDGFSALLARALARTEAEQPVVKEMRRSEASRIRLDVAATAQSHGATAVRAALESLLTALVEILSELVGADMVRNLLDYDDDSQVQAGRRRL